MGHWSDGVSVSSQLLDVARDIGVKVVYDVGSRDAVDGISLLESLLADELHVFECNAPAVELCRKTVEEYSGTGKIWINPVAVSDYVGDITFYPIDPEKSVTTWIDGNIGASSIFRANPEYKSERYIQNEITVPCTTLKEYAKAHSIPDLLWMDLQGGELAALRGFDCGLLKVKIIHIEVSFRPVYVGQPLFHEVNRFLLSLGFRLYALSNLPKWLRVTHTYRLLPILRRGPWFGDAIYLNATLTGRE